MSNMTDADVFYNQASEPMKYHATAHGVIERGELDRLSTPAQAKAAADSWLPVLAKYQIPDSHSFAEAVAEAGRGTATPERMKTWRDQTAAALKADYGDGAGQALRDARVLIASDTKLRAFLEKTRAGDHPKIVRAFAERAAQMRKAGKLK